MFSSEAMNIKAPSANTTNKNKLNNIFNSLELKVLVIKTIHDGLPLIFNIMNDGEKTFQRECYWHLIFFLFHTSVTQFYLLFIHCSQEKLWINFKQPFWFAHHKKHSKVILWMAAIVGNYNFYCNCFTYTVVTRESWWIIGKWLTYLKFIIVYS